MKSSYNVFECLGRAFGILKENVGFLVGVPVLYFIISMVVTLGCMSPCFGDIVELSQSQANPAVVSQRVNEIMTTSPYYWLAQLVSIVMSVIYSVGYSRLTLKAYDGKSLSWGDFVAEGRVYLHYALLVVLLIVAAVVLLLIPVMAEVLMFKTGTFSAGSPLMLMAVLYVVVVLMAVLVSLSFYYIIDRGMGCLSAVGACWRDMMANALGNWLSVLLFIVLAVLINFVGLCVCCVGLLFTIPLTAVTFTCMYRSLSQRD